jgi:hypothetical protein
MATLDWITPEAAGQKWGVKVRQVQALCTDGKIDGAIKMGRMWLIHKDTLRPIDGRTKAAKQTQSTKTATLDIERIIGEVNGTMAIEGMPLTDDDKMCIRSVLNGDVSMDDMIRGIIGEYTTEQPQYGLRI